MSFYFTDEISFKKITRDSVYGNITEVETTGIKARVQNANKVVSQNGEDTGDNKSILLKYSSSLLVSIGDKIKLTKLRGVSVTNDYETITKVLNNGSFGNSYIEVFT